MGVGIYKISSNSLPSGASSARLEIQSYKLMSQLEWLNVSRPLEADDLIGKVVLLDFWTYCCINCIHILPDLKKLEKDFPTELAVIGVHSAKFEQEQDTKNIREAIGRYQIEHPVINDYQFLLWQKFGINSWPSFVILDAEGKLRGQTSGEGQYEKLRSAIAELVEEARAANKLKTDTKLPLKMEKFESKALSFPGKMISDGATGKFWLSDSNHNRILRMDTAGEVDLVIGSSRAGLRDGGFADSQFQQPQGLALTGSTLYVADTGNHALRKIDLRTQKVSTVAGNGKRGYQNNPSGPISKYQLASPWDLDLNDNILAIAMAGTHQIWQLNLKTMKVSVLAGSGVENLEDGAAISASLAQTSGLSSYQNSLYFVDSETSSVRVLEKGRVRTLIGQGLFEFGKKDGDQSQARLQHPLGIAASADKLYVADTYNNDIRVYDLQAKTLSSLNIPNLLEPNDVLLKENSLWIVDTNHHQIKRYDLATRKIESIAVSAPEIPPEMESRQVYSQLPFLPNLKESSVEGGLQNPKKIRLSVSLKLRAGFHLNEKAPSRWELLNYYGKGFEVLTSGKVTKNNFEILVERPKEIGREMILDLSAYFCPVNSSPDAVCEIKSFRTRIIPAKKAASIVLDLRH